MASLIFDIVFYLFLFGFSVTFLGLIYSLAKDLQMIAMILSDIKVDLSNKKRASFKE